MLTKRKKHRAHVASLAMQMKTRTKKRKNAPAVAAAKNRRTIRARLVRAFSQRTI
jgi:hypothetical protein